MDRRLIAMLAAACGTAGADVVVFENTNPALETIQLGFQSPTGDFYPGEFLDITADASFQPVVEIPPPGAVGFFWAEGSTSGAGYTFYVTTAGSDRLARAATPASYVDGFGGTANAFVPEDFDAGDSAGPSSIWHNAQSMLIGAHYFDPRTVELVDDEFTVGVRFQLSGQTHYGFATFERISTPGDLTPDFHPVRWGYETEPSTPVVIPAAPCQADLAEPFGTLDFFDVSAFLSAFNTQDSAADLAEPFGSFDFFDVSAFLAAFNAGCP